MTSARWTMTGANTRTFDCLVLMKKDLCRQNERW
jgi:hypothetical protein